MARSQQLPQVIVVGPSAASAQWADFQEEHPEVEVAFERTFPAALRSLQRAAATTGHVALVRSDVLLDRQIRLELDRAVADPDLKGIPWLLLSSDGLGVDGELIDNGNYRDHAALAQARPLRALAAAEPSVAVLSLDALAGLDADLDDEPTITDLIEQGWDHGLASFASCHLRFSVNGPREGHHLKTGLWGRASSRTAVDPADLSNHLRRVRPDPTLTVAVRTTLARNHMLRRNLASIQVASATRGVESVMVVGTVAPEELDEVASELAERFPRLPLTLESVPESSIPSRSQCLMHVIERATTDYVWFVDDDDMVTPESVTAIKNAIHAAERPLIVAASDVNEEYWSKGDTRPLLMWSQPKMRYDPHAWHRAFTGTNSLPICSLVMPRDTVAARLGDTRLRHDLGEDFALLLLVLTAPGIAVVPVDYSIATISIRPDADNVVTAEDRSGWLREIGSFMSDLVADPHAGSNVTWALGAAVRDSVPVAGGAHDLPALMQRIAQLEQERTQLNQALATMRGYASRMEGAGRGWKSTVKRAVPAPLRPLARKVWTRLQALR